MGLKDKIERFVALHLKDAPLGATKSKFIHDPVWGTVEIHRHECCILDSPLLQRLRQIHQTGFVYATYPSASHTRFEHTIGVMHLAGRIASALIKRHADFADERTEQKVRLAALLHDTGHSAFSHTSEEIYETRDDLKKLLGVGGEFQGKGAGEVLSYLVSTSNAFRNFFKTIRRKHPRILVDVDDFAPLILGKAQPAKQFEADIISGPIDADKLDYFPRDGRASGVELAVDIERLLHCLNIAEVQRGRNRYRLLVVSRGGFNAIQQLLFARATLFASVYHHHKVRACDCMVKAVFEHFCDGRLNFKRNSVFDGFNLKSAADFLFLTDNDFFAEAYQHGSGSIPHTLIHDLLYRRLLKRVLTVSRNTVRDFDDKEQVAAYGHFFNLRDSKEETRGLAKQIHDAAGLRGAYSKVWLDIPRDPSLRKAGDAMINLAPRNGTPRLVKLEEFIPIGQWMETYKQYSAQSFLFGPENKSVRKALAIRAIQILEKEFGLKLNRDAVAEDIRESIPTRILPR